MIYSKNTIDSSSLNCCAKTISSFIVSVLKLDLIKAYIVRSLKQDIVKQN